MLGPLFALPGKAWCMAEPPHPLAALLELNKSGGVRTAGMTEKEDEQRQGCDGGEIRRKESSPGLLAALKRLGLVGPSVAPVSPVMRQISVPPMPSLPRDIPPMPSVDWDFLDAGEPGEVQDAGASAVAQSIYAQRNPDESTAERNARWLCVCDAEATKQPRGAQARAVKAIAQIEGVNDSTVKRGIQDAGKARQESPTSKKRTAPVAKKNGSSDPFGLLAVKGKRSP
jgi:hypothetical protein